MLNLLLIIQLTLCIYSLHGYLKFSLLQIVSVPLFLVVVKNENEKSISLLRIAISFFLLLLYFYFQSKSFLFFSVCILLLEMMANYRGRISISFYFLLFICSPLFIFITETVGFPIQLFLTECVAKLFSIWISFVQLKGNAIYINQEIFFVDTGCAGLSMLLASFLWMIAIIEWFKFVFKKKCTFLDISILFLLAFIANIVSNLFRIAIIILLKSKAETLSHELIGIISFVVYSLIPIYFIGKFYIKNFNLLPLNRTTKKLKNVQPILGIVMIFSILIMSFTKVKIKNSNVETSTITMQGYQKSIANDDVLKFSKQNTLIYVKKINSFLSGEHTPLICWRGSGYVIKNFEESKFRTTKIYKGELYKDNNCLKTAWFYTNGKIITNSQWEWRYNAMMNNSTFYLINITTNNEENLNSALQNFQM